MNKFWSLFEGFRRIIVFFLGVFIIIDGLLEPNTAIPELIVGMVMVGILPIENVIETWQPSRRRRRHSADAD